MGEQPGRGLRLMADVDARSCSRSFRARLAYLRLDLNQLADATDTVEHALPTA